MTAVDCKLKTNKQTNKNNGGEDRLQLPTYQRHRLRFMRPRKHYSQFRMTDYRVLFNKKKRKKEKRRVKNVKYVFRGSQDCGLMVTRTHRFMGNTGLCNSAALNTNTGLIFI